MIYIRKGIGKPLLLIHGLCGSAKSWSTIIKTLSKKREIIAVDLPGFGGTPPLAGTTSINTLSDAMADFLKKEDLIGIDAVGNSVGASVVLELYRRGGLIGNAVASAPVGFGSAWEQAYYYTTLSATNRIGRALQSVMGRLTGNVLTRSTLFAQFSAHPWRLPEEALLTEMHDLARANRFEELLKSVSFGVRQEESHETREKKLFLIWGRDDRICLPSQAQRALRAFPQAKLQWLENCGHSPHWDQPKELERLILKATESPKTVTKPIQRFTGYTHAPTLH